MLVCCWVGEGAMEREAEGEEWGEHHIWVSKINCWHYQSFLQLYQYL